MSARKSRSSTRPIARLPTRIGLLGVLGVMLGCQLGIPPDEAAVPLDVAPRRGQPDNVMLLAGRPARPYVVRAFVGACGLFTSPLGRVREQADGVGANAIIELTRYATTDGVCASGVAVELQ